MSKINIFIIFAVIGIITTLLPKKEFKSVIDDINMCSQKNATKNECNSFQFEDNNFQCCKLMFEVNISDTINSKGESCSVMINPINTVIDEMNTENGIKIWKEYMGFSAFKNRNPGNVNNYEKFNFSCNDGYLPLEFNIKDYSDSQKVLFNDTNYCLNYTSSSKVDKETCYNANVSQSGIFCGYYDFILELNNSNTKNFNTCFLYNDDIVKNKNIGFITKFVTELMSLKVANSSGHELLNYKLTFSRKGGKTVKYDSASGAVEIEGGEEEEEEEEREEEEREEEEKEEEEKEEKEKEEKEKEKGDNSGKMFGLKYMILIIVLWI